MGILVAILYLGFAELLAIVDNRSLFVLMWQKSSVDIIWCRKDEKYRPSFHER